MYEKLPVEIEKRLPTNALMNIYLFLTPLPKSVFEQKRLASYCDMRIKAHLIEQDIINLQKNLYKYL
jgi:hypothetical protein